jgi:hypothetical protein
VPVTGAGADDAGDSLGELQPLIEISATSTQPPNRAEAIPEMISDLPYFYVIRNYPIRNNAAGLF